MVVHPPPLFPPTWPWRSVALRDPVWQLAPLAERCVTRPGIEGGPNVTENRSVTGSSTKGGVLERPPVALDCNECNEALDAVRAALLAAGRLALVAENALVNGDLRRVQSALRNLHHATTSGATPDTVALLGRQ